MLNYNQYSRDTSNSSFSFDPKKVPSSGRYRNTPTQSHGICGGLQSKKCIVETLVVCFTNISDYSNGYRAQPRD